MNTEQLERMASARGFVAALDQSGGSTPQALRAYGVDHWSGEAQMYDLVHTMRARIIASPAFSGTRVLGAIIFEQTMSRQVEGVPTTAYLWDKKGIVPFLKIDKGLAEPADGVQVMRPIPDLEAVLHRARTNGVFGTKMRSVVAAPDPAGVGAVVAQQISVARQVLAAGLVPIVQPEVDIHAAGKAAAEDLLRSALLGELDLLPPEHRVVLLMTLPERDGDLTPFVEHPRVLRVMAVSGGYPRAEATERLARQPGVIACFSRALTEGLRLQQDDAELDAVLEESIAAIAAASAT